MLVIAVVLVAVPFIGWVVWAGVQQSDQDVRWSTTGFRDVSDTSVTVDFDVFLPPDTRALCTVRALDAHGLEVGRAEVPVRTTSDNVAVVYALAVTARPTSAFVDTCRLDP